MSEKQITPLKGQKPLESNQFIKPFKGEHDEQVPMDVLFVGAGPAGLCGAIELARLVKTAPERGEDIGPVEIGVLEKAESLGGHTLSGSVINPRSLKELFPDEPIENFPFRKAVNHEKVYMLTPKKSFRIPTPPTMKNKGYYISSLSEVVKWLGEKAEGLGVNILTSFPADSLLVDGQRVKGVCTTPAGLQRDGSPGAQHMPSAEVTAQITVLTEGTRGPLTQSYLKWQNITSPRPQIYALGVKEVWKVKKPPASVIHTMDWPLPKNCFGGSFMYPLAEDMVSIGLVAGLDYKDHNLDVHQLLQEMKAHPLFKKYLEGGEALEWGAKTIPEGGYDALPEKLYGDGLLMAGDAVGFVNVPALKGVHYAMYSGMLAARAAYKALLAKDTSAKGLSSYDEEIRNSFIAKDLKKVRNVRQAFKNGLYWGGLKTLFMTFTGGKFPSVKGPHLEDAAEEKTVTHPSPEKTKHPLSLSKVDAVYLSGNKTRDDIPQHLTVGTDVSREMAEFYTHLCPAGVYELEGDQLKVNAPNCVDCKATDVVGPRWQPREGGSGPNYTKM